MDLYFCGIIDIVFVLLLILMIFLGYRKGFLKKAISFIGVLVALIVAFVFCQQLAGILKDNHILWDDIYQSIYNRASSSDVLGGQTVKDVLINMGVPNFFAELFANSIGDTNDIIIGITNFFTTIIMNVICFGILFIGVFIIAIVLKILATILRGNTIIRVLDGILGAVLYCCFYLFFVYVLFTIMRYMENKEFFAPVKNFLDVDMKLNDPNSFRLSKFIYEHNIVYSILHIFF